MCGFDYEEIYGELGQGYIQIHHLVPLNEIGREYEVDYKKDLIPICANCHVMIHRKVNGKKLSVEELRNLIK
ncbi:HNH endonuclease [Aerococcus urinaeequi]